MQPTRRPPFPCLGRPPPPYLSFREESSTPSPCWKTREARKGEEHTLFKKGTKAWAPDRSWGRPPGQPSLLSKDAWGKEDSPLGPFARLRPGRTGGGPKKMEGTLQAVPKPGSSLSSWLYDLEAPKERGLFCLF